MPTDPIKIFLEGSSVTVRLERVTLHEDGDDDLISTADAFTWATVHQNGSAHDDGLFTAVTGEPGNWEAMFTGPDGPEVLTLKIQCEKDDSVGRWIRKIRFDPF